MVFCALHAPLQYSCTATGVPQIPYTFVRGNSDFLYNAPQQVSPGVWMDNPNSPTQACIFPPTLFRRSRMPCLLLTFMALALPAELFHAVHIRHPELEHRHPDNVPAEVPGCWELGSNLRLCVAQPHLACLQSATPCLGLSVLYRIGIEGTNVPCASFCSELIHWILKCPA